MKQHSLKTETVTPMSGSDEHSDGVSEAIFDRFEADRDQRMPAGLRGQISAIEHLQRRERSALNAPPVPAVGVQLRSGLTYKVCMCHNTEGAYWLKIG